MLRIIVIIFFLITLLSVNSQTINELECEIPLNASFKDGDLIKNKIHKILSLDKYNLIAIEYNLQLYKELNQEDSIKYFYESLIATNKESPIPYLIRVQLSNYESLNNTEKINYLKRGLLIDSSNVQINYVLGKIYYELFIKEFRTSRKKINLTHYAKNAIIYFSNLNSFDNKYKEVVKIPLMQLASYFGDNKKIMELKKVNFQFAYFPIILFANLPYNWQTDYSINVMAEIESASSRINWFSKHLKALEEPVLSDSLSTKIYRFTYLRTFDNPIVIRIENENEKISIHWKVSNGVGGYEPGKIIENRSKVLTIKDWQYFIESVNSTNFWNLSTTQSGIMGSDGSRWILEGKELGKYHIVDRWLGEIIKSVCFKLLELTDLKIEQDDLY